MLEVVFNESASVSLMMAQKYGNGDYYMKGSTPGFAFYGDSEPTEEEIEKLKSDWMREEEEKWAKAVPLGGSKADIFCFDLLLQIGGVGADFMEERRRVLRRFGYLEPEDLDRHIKDRLERLETFCQRVKDGVEVRIWYGQDAEERCGVLWLCHEMCRRKLPIDKINFVMLSKEKLNTGEVDDAEWWEFADLQTLMDQEEIQFHASQWDAMIEANAPLRVVVNGCVLSATEDFYDEMIWQEIEKAEEEFSQPKLIGRLLDLRIGVPDSWISYRLDRFVETGALKIVAMDHECPWIRVLKRKEQ